MQCNLCHFETHFAAALDRHKIRIHEYPDDAESIASVNSRGSNGKNRNDSIIDDDLEETGTLGITSLFNEQNLMDANISIQTNFLESCGAFGDVTHGDLLQTSMCYYCQNCLTKDKNVRFKVNVLIK